MSDYLASLPVQRVAAWYRRLADRIGRERIRGQTPLASTFLRHWLDNRDPRSTFRFQAPAHVRTSSYVVTAQQFHRRVFLTEERARFTGGRRAWAGVVPRLQGLRGFTRWDGRTPLQMHYESLVEIGSNLFEIVRIQNSGTPEERDLLTSLRGFQLRSRVTVNGAPVQNSRNIRVSFASWMCRVRDRYNFNYSEHFTVPNPDYRSTRSDAVRPQDRHIRVYHRNAQRLERASLAAPYDVESDEWRVTDTQITRPADVDPTRRL
jgi:hypothetical protein